MANAAKKTNVTADISNTVVAADNVELMLSKQTRELIAKVAEHYTVTDGQAVFSKDLYATCLPEGLTMQHVKLKDDYDTALTAATAYVHGQGYLEQLKTNKELSKWDVSFKAGISKVTHTAHNTDEVRNLHTGEKTKRFAIVKTAIKTTAAKASSGDLSRVKHHISTLGAQMLS